MTLRPRRELRSLHAYHALLLVHIHIHAPALKRTLYQRHNDLSETLAEGIAKGSMGNYIRALEKRRGTDTLGSIDDLIGDDEVAWFDLLPE